jgi:hypothetical protein
MLWHWAKRRHPEKSNEWIADKYWHSEGNRNWVFSEGDKKLKSTANSVWGKMKNVIKPETKTMTINCCPN